MSRYDPDSPDYDPEFTGTGRVMYVEPKTQSELRIPPYVRAMQAAVYAHANQTSVYIDNLSGLQHDMLQWAVGEAMNRQARIERRVPANATTSRQFRAGTRRTKKLARR
jgi:hypothetical protein